MNSTTRAKSSLVALIVLALIFVVLSAIAYPSLSSEDDDPIRENTEKERQKAEKEGKEDENGNRYDKNNKEYDPSWKEGDSPYLNSDGIPNTPGVSLEGYVLKGETGEPVVGAEIVLVEETQQDPTYPGQNDRDQYGKDGVNYYGVRGDDHDYDPDGKDREDPRDRDPKNERERDPNRDPEGDPDRDPNRDPERPDGDERPIREPRKWTSRTDRTGHFVFGRLERGVYRLIVILDGVHVHKDRVKYLPGETKPLRIILGHRNDDSRPGEKDKWMFHLHATPVDGDGDGHADDVTIYAAREKYHPLGGVMIHVDGEYIGATSYEGWILSLDYEPGVHKVKGGYHQHTAHTHFFITEEPWWEPEEWGFLEGKVFSDDGPVAGAEIILHNEDHRWMTESGREGWFEFDDLPVGEYFIGVFAKGYHEFKEEIWIGEEENFIEVCLEPMEPVPEEYGHLYGHVYTETEGDELEPVVHAEVALDGDEYGKTTLTGEEGKFSFHYLHEGEYVIEVFAEGYAYHEDEIFIESGEGTEIRIILEREEEPEEEFGNLYGMVINEYEGRIQGAEVSAYHQELDITYHAETNVYGTFHFHEVHAGPYVLLIEAEGYNPGQMEVEVLPGETVQITIVLMEKGE